MNVVAPIHVNFKENGGTHKDQEDDASPFRTSTETSVLNVAFPSRIIIKENDALFVLNVAIPFKDLDILLTICVPVCI